MGRCSVCILGVGGWNSLCDDEVYLFLAISPQLVNAQGSIYL